jgi:hypothetical protein
MVSKRSYHPTIHRRHGYLPARRMEQAEILDGTLLAPPWLSQRSGNQYLIAVPTRKSLKLE